MVPMYTGSAVLFSEDGNTRDLKKKIKALLAQRDEPMSSAQIAEALYVYSQRVSFDLFKRRVIVMVSAMHKADPPELIPSSTLAGRGREIFWELPPISENASLVEVVERFNLKYGNEKGRTRDAAPGG